MSVFVSFASVRGVGSIDAPAVSDVRVRESLAVGGASSAATAEGEIVFVVNGEASPVFVAVGTAPDATLTSKSSVSSAGVAIPAGGTLTLFPPEDSKVGVAATA